MKDDLGIICAFDLPFINKNLPKKNFIYIGLNKGNGQNLYAKTGDRENIFVKKLNHNSVVGIISKIVNGKIIHPNLIDHESRICIYTISQIYELSESDFLSGKNLCIIGEEIIAYRFVKKIDKNIYEISRLMRGLYSTCKAIHQHKEGEQFAIINSLDSILVSDKLMNENIAISVKDKLETNILYKNISRNIDPVKNVQSIISENHLTLSWEHPCYLHDDWVNPYISGFLYEIVLNNGNTIYRYETRESKIVINISGLKLSGESKISILAIREEDKEKSVEYNVNF